jgi:hypothetical protein
MRASIRWAIVGATALMVGSPLNVPSATGAAGTAIVVGSERAVATARPGNIQSGVDVAWDGNRFMAVWQESPAAGGLTQIYATRISAAGQVLDPGGILLSLSDNDHARPTVAGGNGRFFVAWEERPQETYTDLGAAIVDDAGTVRRRWYLSRVDNGQSNPDVAWGGQLFLATWEDEPDPEDQDVYGARVLPSGLTLDGCSSDACHNGDDPGITIGLSVGTDQLTPAVIWTGTKFATVWADANATTPTDIRTNAVAVNADTFFEEGFVVSDAAGSQSEPAIGRSGDILLVAWTDTRSGNADIRFTRLNPGAQDEYAPTPMPPQGTAMFGGGGEQTQPAVARRGTGFVVAWTDASSGNNNVVAARVGIGGTVLDPVRVQVAAGPRNQRGASIADGGGVQLVAYQRDVPASPFDGRDRVFFSVLS